jgi:TRAP-type mannitol/chloroaromatic compound transport system permease small subunit
MERENSLLIRAVRVIDTISTWSGHVAAWLVLPLIAIMTYEITVRYLLQPTLWAYDLSYMLYGTSFMLGTAYTLRRGAHIRTDFLYQKWPVKVQAAVDLACYVLLFFPGIAVFLWISSDFAWRSMLQGERSAGSAWMPIIFPLKAIIPIGTALLLLQGVAELLKCYFALRTGKWLGEHRSLEEILSEELAAATRES